MGNAGGYVGGNLGADYYELPAFGGPFSAGLSIFRSLAGPSLSQVTRFFRAEAGYNDIGEDRRTSYLLNYRTVNPPAGTQGDACRLSVEQAIKFFNQSPWHLADDAPAVERAFRQVLATNLAYSGVAVDPASTFDAAPAWRRLIDMSSAAADLGAVKRAYYRDQVHTPAFTQVNADEMRFQLQRAQFRRKADRDVMLRPYYPWGPSDVLNLWRQGVLSRDERDAMYKSAGIIHTEDSRYLHYLQQVRPSPTTLVPWAIRRLWDESLASKYQLDDGLDQSPLAVFFSKSQGIGGDRPELPNQPPGEYDWLKLSHRAGRPLPLFGVARQLEHRLRPDGNGLGASVVDGLPQWTRANTLDMLRVEGYPEPVIQQLSGLVYEPINIRIINHILTVTLKHPALAVQAQQIMGAGVDWVQNAFLDHGFRPEIAKITANAVRQAAQDVVDLPKTEELKKIRESGQAETLRRYELGVLTTVAAIQLLVDDVVSAEMAVAMLSLIDTKIQTDFVQTATNEIKSAFMQGKINIAQVGAQLDVLGVNDARKTYYYQEWTWAKNDNVRMLSTQEIVVALKSGLMTPELALARLVNLGWTAPDALVEIAAAENEVAKAAANLMAKQASQIVSAEQKAARQAVLAQRQQNAAQAKLDAAAAKAAKAAEKQALGTQSAPIEQAAAAAKYDAQALLDLDAYTAAAGKGEKVKMQAEIDKAVQAYQELLVKQLRLSQIGPEAASEIVTVEPVAIPAAKPVAGVGQNPAKPAPVVSAAPAASGGAGPPPAPG